MVPSLRNIPSHLVASSPRGLERKMRDLNDKKKVVHRYFDFNQLLDGTFICWYYNEKTIEDELKEIEDADRS